MGKNEARKKLDSDKLFDKINMVVLIAVLGLYLYPVIYVISSSFSSVQAIMGGKVWLFPIDPNTFGYKLVFSSGDFFVGLRNSILYTTAGTLLATLLNMMAAYPLSRNYLPGRTAIMFYFTVTMIINGGLIPNYLLINWLGLYNSPLAVVIPFTVGAFNIIICKTFIQQNIPNELLEAAKMDGCGEISFFFRLLIPMVKPLLLVMALQYVIFYWNLFLEPYLYLKNPKYYPVQIILRNILLENSVSEVDAINGAPPGASYQLKFALIVISIIPMATVYLFTQKHFIKGMTMGTLKG